MADVKWIKMNTNMFDNRKIRQIECLPEGYAIIVTWVKLLCLAGNINDSGFIYFTKEIPYTDQMLSTQFNIPLQIIQLSLNVFQQFDMVEIVDDVLHISNWEKYQNVEGMEKIREQTRQRVANYRERKRLCNATCNATVTQCNETEEDIEEDKNKKEDKDSTSVSDVIELYSSICKSYPAIKSVSEARKKAIKARLKQYSLDDFRTLFEKAEASSFLKGSNDRNWSATFDWLIKDSNMAKVIDGNYDGKTKSKNSFNQFQQNNYNMDELEKLLGGG